jgi:hypothetical protein
MCFILYKNNTYEMSILINDLQFFNYEEPPIILNVFVIKEY